MRLSLLAAALAAVLAASPASAEVRLSIDNGDVTLSAKNATVAQILAEWGRVGQTRIVNGERVASAPLTIELAHVTEAQALDIILRSVSGYVLAPRTASAATNQSKFDRIYILPTAAAPRPVTAQAPTAPSFPEPPRFVPPPPPPDDQVVDDQGPAPRGGVGAPPSPAPHPGFVTFPTPQQAPPPGAPGQAPAAQMPQPAQPAQPVYTPGMIVPAPPASNRDVRAPQQPPQQ